MSIVLKASKAMTAIDEGDTALAKNLLLEIIREHQKSWEGLSEKDLRKRILEDFTQRWLAAPKQPKTVTEFITTRTIENDDNFYTPMEVTFDSKEKAHKEWKARSWGEWDKTIEPRDKYGAHPDMVSWLELPYGHICDSCGGSMVALIQLDANGNHLRTTLADCG